MEKLLIIETITWKPFVETAMEIAIRSANSGTQVAYYNLKKGLPLVEDHHWIHHIIDLPSIRVNHSHRLLKTIPKVHHSTLTHSYTDRKKALKTVKRILKPVRTSEQFLEIAYKDFVDIGWGALSSAVTILRDSSVNFPKHKKILSKLLASSILVYEKAIGLIEKEKPTKTLVFNGRFATTLAILRASDKCKIPWSIYERGCDKDHYSLENYRPHDMDARQQHMVRAWRPEHKIYAHGFFKGRRERSEKDWHSFTKNQVYGKIPEAMRDGNKWITLFTSSDDEMVAIGKNYSGGNFPKQLDAIEAVAAITQKTPGLRLCIRVHPHIAKKSKGDRLRWTNLNVPQALVIGPEEDIDSYALIDHSYAIICYGSTIGVEATYWRKPSLLLGRSFYDKLGAVEVANSQFDVLKFLQNPKVKPVEGAHIYGAFFATFGERFTIYNAKTFHSGTILEKNLDESLLMKIIRYILRTLKIRNRQYLGPNF